MLLFGLIIIVFHIIVNLLLCNGNGLKIRKRWEIFGVMKKLDFEDWILGFGFQLWKNLITKIKFGETISGFVNVCLTVKLWTFLSFVTLLLNLYTSVMLGGFILAMKSFGHLMDGGIHAVRSHVSDIVIHGLFEKWSVCLFVKLWTFLSFVTLLLNLYTSVMLVDFIPVIKSFCHSMDGGIHAVRSHVSEGLIRELLERQPCIFLVMEKTCMFWCEVFHRSRFKSKNILTF